MSPKRKPPRLWLRPAKGKRPALWLILDRGRQYSTGCGADDVGGAQRALAGYLARTHGETVRTVRRRDPADVPIADVLIAYWQEHGEQTARPAETKAILRRLAEWWGALMVDDIVPETCARYVRERGSPTAAARELAYLRAAVRRAHANAMIRTAVPVQIPPNSPPRERWLTRSEVARLLWACRGTHQRHIARYVLVAIYTGRRTRAILTARLRPSVSSGWIDLDRGVWHGAGSGEKRTKKRRPEIRIPDRLLAHMRRWRRLGYAREYLIERHGKPIETHVWQGFQAAARRAELEHCTPHDLRRTSVTWAAQAGADPYECLGYYGMTMETWQRHYAKHSPDHQGSVHRAFKGRSVDATIDGGWRGRW